MSQVDTWTDRQFNRVNLILVGSVGWLKRGFSAAMGCSVRLSWNFQAGVAAGVAVGEQIWGGQARPAGMAHG